MFGRSGTRHPNWRGGLSSERQLFYTTREWKNLQAETFKRDGYHCRKCGKGRLSRNPFHAHHVRPWAIDIVGRLNLSNLVTLHKRCHDWVHSKQNVSQEFLDLSERKEAA